MKQKKYTRKTGQRKTQHSSEASPEKLELLQ